MSVNTHACLEAPTITYFGVNFPAVYPDSNRTNATRNERFLRDAILKRHNDINELFGGEGEAGRPRKVDGFLITLVGLG